MIFSLFCGIVNSPLENSAEQFNGKRFVSVIGNRSDSVRGKRSISSKEKRSASDRGKRTVLIQVVLFFSFNTCLYFISSPKTSLDGYSRRSSSLSKCLKLQTTTVGGSTRCIHADSVVSGLFLVLLLYSFIVLFISHLLSFMRFGVQMPLIVLAMIRFLQPAPATTQAVHIVLSALY